MRINWARRSVGLALLLCGYVAMTAMVRVEAKPRSTATAAQSDANRATVGPDNIGGVVTSTKGPEAGVWVIAETSDFKVKFRKIVVTDDQGRYLLPELPKANFKVWVRGYGLVDSEHVDAKPGMTLALTAVIAPNERAAAQYYPANYWYALLNIPPKSAFPMKIPPTADPEKALHFADCRQNAARCAANAARDTVPGLTEDDVRNGIVVANQGEYIFNVKRLCEDCHQMGDKATREIEPELGTFKSSVEAWDRRVKAGQVGGRMMASLDTRFGHDAGLKLFADWSDRIAGGELPPAPPRPEGVERNVVLSVWDYATDKAFVHDITASYQWDPTVNAYGTIYGGDFSANTLEYLDPQEFVKGSMQAPMTHPEERSRIKPRSWPVNEAPSPYWGNQIIWDDPTNPSEPRIDRKGRVWYRSQSRAEMPDFCKAGSNNPFAKNFPWKGDPSGLAMYDPKTGKQVSIDFCGGGHTAFAKDKDDTLYLGVGLTTGGISWLKTRVWDETHDAEKSQGWCPAVIDYNGDGKTGPFTRPPDPPDPKLDRLLEGVQGYGMGVSPVDGSVWVVGGVNGGPKASVPGKIVRYTIGSNPPATCTTEVYEPPFNNPKAPGVEGYETQGVEIDNKGVAWVSLGGSAHLASFDRTKCKVLRGPTATGQHCPEGWTLYPVPGPVFKGTDVRSDYFYLDWVDRENTLGLGKDIPLVDGTTSDSLIAYIPDQKKFVTMRVPYPMGFYTRSMDGRIDNPKIGWKGRGIWAGNNERVVWHVEGGKGMTSQVVHFQIRPDPLAR